MEIPNAIKQEIAGFIIFSVFYFILFAFIMLGAWKGSRSYKPSKKFFHIVFALFSCLLILPTTMAFFMISKATILNSNILTNQFYIEAIIAAALYGSFWVVILIWFKKRKTKTDEELRNDVIEESILPVAASIFVIVLSVLFIFTNIRISIQSWGFIIFGKQIGQWLYNLFHASILFVSLSLIRELIQTPISILFGSPLNHIPAIFDD